MFVVAVISLEVSTLTIAVALVVFGFISYLVTISLGFQKVLCHLTANDTLKISGGSRIFQMGGALFCHKWGGAHPVFR